MFSYVRLDIELGFFINNIMICDTLILGMEAGLTRGNDPDK